jgi:hypothetical protein
VRPIDWLLASVEDTKLLLAEQVLWKVLAAILLKPRMESCLLKKCRVDSVKQSL